MDKVFVDTDICIDLSIKKHSLQPLLFNFIVVFLLYACITMF
jgi:hypothetical protein